MNTMVLIGEKDTIHVCSCYALTKPSLEQIDEIIPIYRSAQQAYNEGWRYKSEVWVCPKCQGESK